MPGGRSFNVVPITRVLFVEGKANKRAGGPFSGFVLAIGWWSVEDESADSLAYEAWIEGAGGEAPEMHYLVSDTSKPAPIWVATSKVTRQAHGLQASGG
jgi:hypothetical protein